MGCGLGLRVWLGTNVGVTSCWIKGDIGVVSVIEI